MIEKTEIGEVAGGIVLVVCGYLEGESLVLRNRVDGSMESPPGGG